MLDRIGKGDRISLAGAVALFFALFSPWYGVKADGGALGDVANQFLGNASADAFDAFKLVDILLLVLALGSAALIVSVALGKVDEQYHRYVEYLGIAAFVLVLFRLIVKPGTDVSGFSTTLKWGVFLALLAAAAIAVGQYLQRTDKL